MMKISFELSFEDLQYWDLEVNNPDVFYICDGLMGYYPDSI